jgi:hypothetical protein
MSKPGSDQPHFDEAVIKRIFVIPFCCINFSPDLVGDHEPLTSTEVWVAANAKLIEQIGATEWLHLLLAELSDSRVTT